MKYADWLRMMFGLLLLIAITALAVLVEKEPKELQAVNNTDLQQIITLFGVLAGAFAQWAFNHDKVNGGPKT